LFRLPPELTEHLQRGGTLLVPSRQRARAVQLAYAAAQLARGLSAWASADVLSLSGWLRRETERAAGTDPQAWPRLLSAAEEWYLWREATAAAAATLELLDALRLSESLRRAAGIAADYGIAVRELPGDAEATLLAKAQRLFTQRCTALNAVTAADLTAPLVERAQRGGNPPWLRGFGALPPRLRALGAAAAGGALSEATVLRPPRARDELEAIAAWCHAHVAAAPDARILVMLPGPAGARERLAALIREALDPASVMDHERLPLALAGIEGGQPLNEAPLIAHALLSLRVLAGEELEFTSVTAWLRTPHWHSPSAAARAALAQLLGERPVATLDVRELRGALQLAPPRLKAVAQDLDTRLAQAQAALAAAGGTPRLWAERCAAALTALGLAAGAASDRGAQQTLMRWHELLEEFGDLSACVPRLAAGQGVTLLREFAGSSAFRPADEDPVVTISATLADPVVIYDGIWVGGLSAQVLPQPVHPDPFLPLAAQLAAGVPAASALARAAQGQALLGSWRRGSTQLVLSVPALAQDLELLPSPLLAGLEPAATSAAHRWLPAFLHRPGLTESLDDARGDRWDVEDTVPGGTRVVTLQSQCPFRAYAELRLGAKAAETAEPGIAADKRGVLLHAALQILWERLHDHATLARLAPRGLDERISEAVAQAAGSMLALEGGRRRRGRRADEGQFDLFVQLPAVLERECRRAERLIRRLCELELTRRPFTVAGTEQSAELVVAGARLRMRLDRVDALPEGRVILDYKSGRAKSADWYGERPTHPQLLAYLAALGEDVAALATVHVTAREVCFSGVAAQAGLLPKVVGPPAGAAAWPEQQAQWRALVERLVNDFVAGAAQVDPATPQTCSYCHVIDICRILERTGRAESILPGDEDE
jgi:ATP-dependent helicase/nuclease subunit B